MFQDFAKICRVCMAENVAMTSIWDEHAIDTVGITHNTNQSSLSDSKVLMLKEFSSYDVTVDDELPQNICFGCANDLQIAFLFKLRCERAEIRFKIYLKSLRLKQLQESTSSELLLYTTDQKQSHMHKNNDIIVTEKQTTDQQKSFTNCTLSDETEKLLRGYGSPLPKSLNHFQKSSANLNGLLLMELSTQSHNIEENLKNDNDKQKTEMATCIKNDVPVGMDANSTLTFGVVPVPHSISELQNPLLTLASHLTQPEKAASPLDCDFGTDEYAQKEPFELHRRSRSNLQINLTDCANLLNKLAAPDLSVCEKENSTSHTISGRLEVSNALATTNLQNNHDGSYSIPRCDQKPFVCDICNKSFKNKSQIRLHLMGHTQTKPFKCTYCAASFFRKYHLNRHLNSHTGERLHRCNVCDKQFFRREKLKAHLMRHMQPEALESSLATQSIGGKNDLNRNKICNSADLPFKCQICDKNFNQKWKLNVHLNGHAKIKPFKCTECPISFNHSGNLTRHLKVHTGIRPFQCSLCEKGFVEKVHLKKHLLCHTRKEFKCKECPLSFIKKIDLYRHNTLHNGTLNYTCYICGEGFKHKNHIRHHLYYHMKRQQDSHKTKTIKQIESKSYI